MGRMGLGRFHNLSTSGNRSQGNIIDQTWGDEPDPLTDFTPCAGDDLSFAFNHSLHNQPGSGFCRHNRSKRAHPSSRPGLR